MPITPADQRLLGLAEELSSATAHLNDPEIEALVHQVLDGVVDGMVDIARHRTTFSRAEPARAGATGRPPPGDLAAADRASCTALAAQCHRLAAHLTGLDRPLAPAVAQALRVTAEGLQQLVQDLPQGQRPAVRQRLLRALRRAGSALQPIAPLE